MAPIPSFDFVATNQNLKLLESANYKRPLTQDERKTKNKIAEWSAKGELIKDMAMLVSKIVLIGVVVCICVFLITNPSASVDDKKWATTIIGTIIGYLIGKEQKP